MKIYFLLYPIISIASAGSLTQILDGGYTKFFGADPNGFSYLLTDDFGRYTFWILNSSNEVHVAQPFYPFADLIKYMTFSSQGDSYFVSVKPITGYTLNLMPRRDVNPIIIDQEPFTTILSDNNNVFYSKDTPGVYMVKPKSNTPIPIKNTENMSIFLNMDQGSPVNSLGNVYFLTQTNVSAPEPAKLVKLTNEALEDEVPNAELVDLDDLAERMFPRYLFVDDRDSVWIIGMKKEYDGTIIKKLVGNNWETMTILDSRFNRCLFLKDRFLFFDIIPSNDIWLSKVYAVTLDENIIKYPELNDLTIPAFEKNLEIISDNEGSIYFASPEDFSPSLGKLFMVKANETKPIPITVGNMTMNPFLRVGCDNDIWMVLGESPHLGSEIYRLKKTSTTMEKMLGPPPEGCYAFTDVFFNCATNTVFVSCMSGLYIFNEN